MYTFNNIEGQKEVMIYSYILLLGMIFLALWSLVFRKDLLSSIVSFLIITFSMTILFLFEAVKNRAFEGQFFGIVLIMSSIVEITVTFVFLQNIKKMEGNLLK